MSACVYMWVVHVITVVSKTTVEFLLFNCFPQKFFHSHNGIDAAIR